MMSLLRRLAIQDDEAAPFVWSALVLLLVNIASFVLNNYAETTFLKRFGVEYLPQITAINAIVTFVLLNFFGGRLGRVRGNRLLFGTLLCYALLSAALRLAVNFQFSLIYPLLYILKTQYNVLLAFLFWNLASDLFSARQAKRLFPLITSGGIFGAICGSLATPVLVNWMPTDQLLLVFALMAGLAAVCALPLGRFVPVMLSSRQRQAPVSDISLLGEFRQVGPLLRSSTLAKILLLLTLLPNLVIPILNYQFSYIADMSFAAEKSLINFFGYFRSIQNGIALVLSLVAGRLYGRFGLAVSLMFHPANYLFVFAALLLKFNLPSAVYGNLSAGVLRRAINNPAASALYSLLSPEERAILRPFLRGTVVRIAILAGSGLLWFSNMFMPPRYLAVYGLVFGGLWLTAVFRLKRSYPAILTRVVEQTLPDFHRMGREFGILFKGQNLEQTLLDRLRDAEGEEARWCAEMLKEAGCTEKLDRAILEKLPRTDDQTRILLLPLLSEHAGREVLDLFLSLRDPHKPQLMLALACTAHRVFADMPGDEEETTFRIAEISEVKACFLGWMAKDDPKLLDRTIASWIESPDPGKRRAAFLALQAHGEPRHLPLLEPHLTMEQDRSVLALALYALPRVAGSRSGELVLPFLGHADPLVRQAAVSALSPEDEAGALRLVQALGDPAEKIRKLAMRKLEQLPRTLYPLLLERMTSHSRWIRDGLFEVATHLELQDKDFYRFCLNQLRQAYQTLLWSDPVADRPQNAASRLLLRHLEERRRQHLANAIRVLVARDENGQLETAWRALQSSELRQRQDGMEALESLLAPRLARLILPLLEETPDRKLYRLAHRHLGLRRGSEKSTFGHMLDDTDWVTVVLMLESLAGWKEVAGWRQTIEKLAAEGKAAVAHAARHALLAAEGTYEEDLSCLVDRIENIRHVDLFSELTTAQLAAAAWKSTVIRCADGEVIAGTERPHKGLLLTVEGEVAFVRTDPEAKGPGRELHRIGPGDWFGAAVMFGMPPKRMLAAVARGRTLLIQIDRETFHQLVLQNPELGLKIAKGLAKVVGDVLQGLNRPPRRIDDERGDDIYALQGSYCSSEDECSLYERMRLLRQIDLFVDLDNRPLTALAMVGREQTLKAGAELRENDLDGTGLFLVASGELIVARQRHPLQRKGPGSYFGLASLFELHIEGLVIRAETDSHLVRIPPEEFRASVLEHPVIAIKCCEALSRLQSRLLDEVLAADTVEGAPP
ncbi:ATP/ADP translocase [Geothermobacter ehrlichii]|uniref:ATP/ADP translocase n=1 Tax=Geothermobacter ehrlichii TaxID=213224 RepID=A0A5D3WEZ7_9BACT|nr:cyclic nucleotide-binding domain-containing protein [Geothermobacter ehrlichii]TYO95848.1 ATP/ADP translocase [Geothermobacter ehrlichii]